MNFYYSIDCRPRAPALQSPPLSAYIPFMPTLQLLPRHEYRGVNEDDPIRLYYRPFLGPLYRRRVEMCLEECTGGERVLEVGFGTGLSFLNLASMYKEIYGIDLTADIEQVRQVFAAYNIHPDLRNGNVTQLPYADDTFDTVLLISILEHLKPAEQTLAFDEIRRVLKPGGQVVYGVPVERAIMILAFRLLGVNIREHHFSTEHDVERGALATGFEKIRLRDLKSLGGVGPCVYQVGHFRKPGA
jgi:2-polyprenyl-3-methyl-5-hydroxy-6-metoxy-1,4-benzoquinol methylase